MKQEKMLGSLLRGMVYGAVASAGLMVGFLGGNYAGNASAVYAVDKNKDGRDDIAVKSRRGDLEIFLGQENGRFTRLEDVNDKLFKGVEAKVKELK